MVRHHGTRLVSTGWDGGRSATVLSTSKRTTVADGWWWRPRKLRSGRPGRPSHRPARCRPRTARRVTSVVRQSCRSYATPHHVAPAPPHSASRSRRSIPAGRRIGAAACAARQTVRRQSRPGRVPSSPRRRRCDLRLGRLCAGWDRRRRAGGRPRPRRLDDIEAAGDTGLAIVRGASRRPVEGDRCRRGVRGLDPQRRSRPTRRRVVLGRRVHRSPGRHARAPGCRRSAPQRARRRRRWRRRRQGRRRRRAVQPADAARARREDRRRVVRRVLPPLAEGGVLLSFGRGAEGQLGRRPARPRDANGGGDGTPREGTADGCGCAT